MSERGPFATDFDRWAAGYLANTSAQVNLVLPPMRAAWQARADLAAERERELVEALKMVLPLAWRDHRYKEEQLLLENTERLVAKIDAQEKGNG